MISNLLPIVGIWALTWSLAVFGQAQPLTLDGAKWIWFTAEPNLPLSQFPESTVFFRAAVTLPEKAAIKSADVALTCDNLFLLTINGKTVGESDEPNAWNQPKRFDVAKLLAPGRNVLAIEAMNTAPGPAALIGKLIVQLADGQQIVLVSDGTWKSFDTADLNWQAPGFDDSTWRAARVMGEFGMAPWGKFAVPATSEVGQPSRLSAENEQTAGAEFKWPEAIAFVGDDCSLYRPRSGTGTGYDSLTVTIFNPRDSRAFPEHDLPAPMKVGHKLYMLKPAQPGVKPQVLLDAGKGALGSPSVSYDGKWIYVSMAFEAEPFYHIYRVPAKGGKPQRLTDGPFHDIDPVELPDGRIAFTSTRTGTFEEYHNPPSRALFAMNPDGRDIRPITATFIFDNEPEVLADGRILFIRSDNFFDRGKVETLLHAVHPDGTEGYTEFGLDLGPEYGGRLRAFNCGSPAPMPDGRVAYVTGGDITIGRPGSLPKDLQHLRVAAGDVAALPDGRLLCTLARVSSFVKTVKNKKRTTQQYSYEKIGIVDPDSKSGRVTVIYDSPDEPLHSPVYLGPRPKPPTLAHKVDDRRATGILVCQNARFTKNTTAGWSHVRAMRVLAGKGLTVRSSHSYIVHAGSDVTELGTVPLAPDGSFAVEVPADTAIAFQAVDAEGRSELNEMSWIYVRPGETRGCVGCHQPRQVAPPDEVTTIQALRSPPLKLLGQGDPLRFRGNNAAVTGLMELQFDRYREVAGINRHTATVASLIAQLKSGDDGLRVTAAQRLAIFRDPAAASALVELLRDRSREVRVAAAFALGTCGNRDSVPSLLKACADEDLLVAQAAGIALENLTGRNPHPDPLPYTTRERGSAPVSSPRLRGEDQGEGLWRDWATIESNLVAQLANSDRDVVRRAAVALGHTGGSDAARAALRQYLARERNNNPLPEWRKTHQGDGARFNSLADVNPRTLQAVTRSLGYMKDKEAVVLLAETLNQHSNPATGNLFLAEAAAEALGRIGTPEAEAALVDAFAKLGDYFQYSAWYGDHGALIACHSSPVHYLIIEALDALGSTKATGILPKLIESVPTDTDRALFPENDDYELLTGRVIRRAGADAAVVETCLSILGDTEATRTKEIEAALGKVHQAWGGRPDPENRAAHILSLVCRDTKYEPRIRAAFERYRTQPNDDIKRVFDTGIPVVTKLPVKNWVCFFLGRALGNLAQPASVDALLAALEKSPAELASGSPDPLGPGVLFLHNDLTPCWRAAAAWALGRIGDKRAAPALLKVVGSLDNAPDVRHAAAVALGRINDPASVKAMQKLAATYPEVSTRKALLEAATAK